MTAKRTDDVLGAEIERLRAATYCSARGGVEIHASPELWQNVRKFGEAIAAAARREGAEEMRERCAIEAAMVGDTAKRYVLPARQIARRIRALPAGEE